MAARRGVLRRHGEDPGGLPSLQNGLPLMRETNDSERTTMSSVHKNDSILGGNKSVQEGVSS